MNSGSYLFHGGTLAYCVAISLMESQSVCLRESFQKQFQAEEDPDEKRIYDLLKKFQNADNAVDVFNKKRGSHLHLYDTLKYKDASNSYCIKLFPYLLIVVEFK